MRNFRERGAEAAPLHVVAVDGQGVVSRAARPNRGEWISYYSGKRIVQQWTQLTLLAALECDKVLEIGPALGLVTSMLKNAGYDVTTLDNAPRGFVEPVTPHICRDIRDLKAEEIVGFDAILCCETLEHVEWPRVGQVLATLRRSGARYLVISVPYMGFQLSFDFYLNRHLARGSFTFKKLKQFVLFRPNGSDGHHWEVGYMGHSLGAWEQRIAEAGWEILRREFTAQCRSVFHVLEAAPSPKRSALRGP
jgi:hypothetical protein